MVEATVEEEGVVLGALMRRNVQAPRHRVAERLEAVLDAAVLNATNGGH